MIIKQTIVIIHNDKTILLGLKKRGFGQGRWNGFGGKVKDSESIKKAAIREIWEETTIKITRLDKIGTLRFSWINKNKILEVHIFKAREYFGQPRETEEMKPRWFPTDKIPFKKMWPDDPYWFPYFLADQKFMGKFVFDAHDRIISHQLKKVDKL